MRGVWFFSCAWRGVGWIEVFFCTGQQWRLKIFVCSWVKVFLHVADQISTTPCPTHIKWPLLLERRIKCLYPGIRDHSEITTIENSLLSNVLDHQVAACVKTDFLSIFLYILIMLQPTLESSELKTYTWGGTQIMSILRGGHPEAPDFAGEN